MIITRGYGDEIVNFVEQAVGELEKEDNFIGKLEEDDEMVGVLEPCE